MGKHATAAVLAVDDNSTIRKAIAMRLTAKGFQVSTASGGEEALECIARAPYDLVLLDLQMPGLGGDEVLRDSPTLLLDPAPVIMLAASNDKADITQSDLRE